MEKERVMISTSGPRSTCSDIHSLLKFLYLKPRCVDTLILKYFIAKDAQLRARRREFGNDVQQIFARPMYMCSCSEGLRKSKIFYDRISDLSVVFCFHTDDVQAMLVSSLGYKEHWKKVIFDYVRANMTLSQDPLYLSLHCLREIRQASCY